MRRYLKSVTLCRSYLKGLNLAAVNMLGSIECNRFSPGYLIRKPTVCMNFSTNVYQKRFDVISASDLVKHINDDMNVSLKLITQILDNTTDFEKLTEEEIILLLEQCGDCIPNESCHSRDAVCQRIFEGVKNTSKLTLNVFNTYIRVCIENRVLLAYDEVMSTFKVEPTQQTYKLLLQNICEKGDVSQAFNVLSDMKSKELPIDGDVFNSLVLVHTIFG